MNNIDKIKPKELFRFVIGGGSAVLADYLTYQLFLNLGVELSYAKACSFICGSIVGFIINKLWTFESKGFNKKEIIKYICLYTITAVINVTVNKVALYLSEIEIIGFLAATGVSTILNFLGQKYFVFHRRA